MTSLRLAWHATGPAAAPMVLWLHGFLGARGDWAALAARMPARRHLFVDLPGHGGSPRFGDDRAGFDALTATLVALVCNQGADRDHLIDVVGYSLGARVAMALAPVLAARGVLRRIALMSGHPGIIDLSARRARLGVDERRAARLRDGGLPAFVQAWYATPLLRSLTALPGGPAIIARRTMGDVEGLARTLVALSTGQQPDRVPALMALGAAVMWLVGADDAVYAPLLSATQRRTPDARLTVVPDAGHQVHLERPEPCVAALRTHFSG